MNQAVQVEVTIKPLNGDRTTQKFQANTALQACLRDVYDATLVGTLVVTHQGVAVDTNTPLNDLQSPLKITNGGQRYAKWSWTRAG